MAAASMQLRHPSLRNPDNEFLREQNAENKSNHRPFITFVLMADETTGRIHAQLTFTTDDLVQFCPLNNDGCYVGNPYPECQLREDDMLYPLGTNVVRYICPDRVMFIGEVGTFIIWRESCRFDYTRDLVEPPSDSESFASIGVPTTDNNKRRK